MFAKYPFLKAVKDYVGPFKVADVTEEMEVRAENRILAAIKAEPDRPGDTRLEITSFYVARIMLSILNNPPLTYKWVGHEMSQIDIEDDEIPVLSKAFGVVTPIHFVDYIKLTENITNINLLLPSQTMVRGYIRISDRNIRWLLKDLVRLKYAEGIPLKVSDLFNVERIAQEAEKRGITNDYGDLNPDAFPPCVRVSVRNIRAGRKVSHPARVFLTSFLHKVGMSRDDIINVFLASPKANPEMTAYQVDSIINKYDVTACLKLISGGDCPEPDRCLPKAKHPLGVYMDIKRVKEA